MRTIISMLLWFLLVVFLDGCASNADDFSPSPEKKSGIITGNFYGSGTVNFFVIDEGGTSLISSVDFIDNFEVEIQYANTNKYILVEVVDATYHEYPYADEVAFLENQKMYSMGYSTAGEKTAINVTAISHIMTAYVLYLLKNNYTVEDALNTALNLFNQMYDIDIAKAPLTIADSNIANSISFGKFRYGLLLAGISKMMLDLNTKNGNDRFSFYNSVELSQAAYADIESDGILDGKNIDADIFIDKELFDLEFLRHKLALNLFKVGKEFLQQINKTDYLAISQKINDFSNEFINFTTPISLDEGGPKITLANQIAAYYQGPVELIPSATDVIEIAAIQYFVDGDLKYNEQNLESPTYTHDSTSLPDGNHEYKIVVENILGSVNELVINLSIDDTKPVIGYSGITSVINYPFAECTLNGTVSDNFSNIKTMTIDGVLYQPVNETWEIKYSIYLLSLAPYVGSRTLYVEDYAGNSTSVTYNLQDCTLVSVN